MNHRDTERRIKLELWGLTSFEKKEGTMVGVPGWLSQLGVQLLISGL